MLSSASGKLPRPINIFSALFFGQTGKVNLTWPVHKFRLLLVAVIFLSGFFFIPAPCQATDFEWVEVDEKDPHDFVLELHFEIKEFYATVERHFFKKKAIVYIDNPDGTQSISTGPDFRSGASCSIGCGPNGSTTTSTSSSVLALDTGLQVEMSVSKSGLKNGSYKKSVLIPWNQTDFLFDESPWKIQAKMIWAK